MWPEGINIWDEYGYMPWRQTFNAAVKVDDLDAITVEASDPNDYLRLDLSSGDSMV